MKGIILKMKPKYNPDEHKGSWFNAEVKIKPTDKEAEDMTKFQIALAPDNKLTNLLQREFEFTLARNGKSYYPKLSQAERDKASNYGRNKSSYKSSGKPESSTGGNSDKKTQLNYFTSSAMQIIAAKINQGDKKLSKLNNEELIEEALRMANKIYKKIHK